MSDSLHLEVAILNEALERSEAEREAFLQQACAGQPQLLEQVRELLHAHDLAARSFLELPPAAVGRARSELATVLITEKPGDRIGRYKLLQPIGEGGCGVVYMAEQEEPVRRRVALKVIKLGMDTKEVIARFEAERQALALMDHPNIAKVLDAGATDTGRPYFVMELVRGVKITEFCDQSKLSTQDRLELFIQVCQAIQHAHQKGIIHRDIKPSNILVTTNDGVPVPKVIDFGIAKATAGRLTDRTLFTAFEQFMGTPAYMSPEQAVMTSLDIDTRSDIYSLGVLLHELLTGRTPFDSKELFAAGFEAMRRTIREQEPVRPSTRLSTMAAEALKTIAQLRHTDPPKLLHVVRGDLDWIVMKCLEKDRGRRYESASGLAADLRRHLLHEPILARPPGGYYRVRKLVRRHRLGFAMGAAVALSLLAGLAIALWQYREKSEAYERVLAAERKQGELRRRAETEAARRDQVANFLRDMLKGAGPSVAKGRDATILREILDATAAHVGQGLTNQPGVEAELRDTLGQVYLQLGQLEKAEEMQREALRLLRTLPGNDDLDVAGVLNNLASTLVGRSRFDEAEKLYRESLALHRQLAGEESPDVTRSLLNLTGVFIQQGRLVEGEASMLDVISRLRRAREIDNGMMSKALNGLGLVFQRLGRHAEAEPILQEALVLQRQVFGEDSLECLSTLNVLGNLYADAGRVTQAEETFRAVLASAERFYGEEHPMVGQYLNNLGYFLRRRAKLDDAETVLRRGLAMQRRLLGTNHIDLAATLSNLGNVLRDQHKLEDAESFLRQAIRLREDLMGADHAETLGDSMNLALVLHAQNRTEAGAELLKDVAVRLRTAAGTNGALHLPRALVNRSAMLDALGRYAEAETVAKEAMEVSKAHGNQQFLVMANLNYSLALQHQKRFPEAEKVLLEVVAILSGQPNARDNPDLAHALHNLGSLLNRQGKYAEAETRYQEAIAAWRANLGSNHPNLARSLHSLAALWMERGRFEEAEVVEREALDIRRKRYGNGHQDTASAVWNMALILEARKKWEDAEAALEEVLVNVKKGKSEDDLEVARVLERLARARLALKKYPAAAAAARECLRSREVREPDGWRTFDVRSLLGEALLSEEKYAEAEPLLIAGWEGLQKRRSKVPRAQRSHLDDAVQRLVWLYERTNRPEEAAKWRRQTTGGAQR